MCHDTKYSKKGLEKALFFCIFALTNRIQSDRFVKYVPRRRTRVPRRGICVSWQGTQVLRRKFVNAPKPSSFCS